MTRSIKLPNLNHANPWMALYTGLFAGLIACLCGCGTTTQKLGTEQLLMSDAVDTAISKIDFRHLAGQRVYLDTTYIKPVKSVGFVNSDYIVSSLRQQLAGAHCLLQDSAAEADIIVEPRVGALGSDGHEVTYGVPKTSALSTAAAIFTSVPIAPTIPEISLGRNVAQSGIAKVVVFAYERESKLPIWQSGVAKSESTSSSTWLLGAGPFQKGTIYEGFRFAGKDFNHEKETQKLPPTTAPKVAYDTEFVFDRPPIREIATKPDDPVAADGVKEASHEEEVVQPAKAKPTPIPKPPAAAKK